MSGSPQFAVSGDGDKLFGMHGSRLIVWGFQLGFVRQRLKGHIAPITALATTPEEVWKPDLLRVRGDLLARQGAEASAVEASYREAMDLARRHGAKAFELRATTSFGRWLQAQGRAAEARDLLAPLYASFTEGFDTRDLVEAKALLAELA